MIWTRHARKRAEERFPGVDLAAAYRAPSTRRPSKALRRRIARQCPDLRKGFGPRAHDDRYLLVTRELIVFVMAPEDVVVTVFQLRQHPDWG